MVIFKEEDMLVEIELVNGDAIGEIIFFITSTTLRITRKIKERVILKRM